MNYILGLLTAYVKLHYYASSLEARDLTPSKIFKIHQLWTLLVLCSHDCVCWQSLHWRKISCYCIHSRWRFWWLWWLVSSITY